MSSLTPHPSLFQKPGSPHTSRKAVHQAPAPTLSPNNFLPHLQPVVHSLPETSLAADSSSWVSQSPCLQHALPEAKLPSSSELSLALRIVRPRWEPRLCHLLCKPTCLSTPRFSHLYKGIRASGAEWGGGMDPGGGLLGLNPHFPISHTTDY